MSNLSYTVSRVQDSIFYKQQHIIHVDCKLWRYQPANVIQVHSTEKLIHTFSSPVI
jgi:hypothetical protein